MTVGEKIQLYRKKIGLSQEELGQKMLVSRQTVSLWEMDKTLPTVDNLLRLKEIFSVSVDDLLCETQEEEAARETPKESYVFQYTPSDLQAIFPKMYAPVLKRGVLLALACVILFLWGVFAKAHPGFLGLILGYFLLGTIFYVKGYFTYKKAWQNSATRVTESTYSYEIFDGYFVVNISRNEEILRTQKIYFDDIEKMQTLDKYLILQSSGQSYMLRKEDLMPDSAFIHWCKSAPNPIKAKKLKGILKIISLLFLLSCCMLGGALLGVAILIGVYPGIKAYLWGFLLCLPMPVAAIVFGYYLKGKGYRYKLNVIIGFIIAVLLCVFGYIAFV